MPAIYKESIMQIQKMDRRPDQFGRVRLMVPGMKAPIFVRPFKRVENAAGNLLYEVFLGGPRERTVKTIRGGEVSVMKEFVPATYVVAAA